MENAGSGLYYHIKKRIKPSEKIVILAGKGNNGGDGIVLARYLKNNGYKVSLIFPSGLPKTQTAKEHLTYYQTCGYEIDPFTETIKADVIVDGLLGVGSRLPLRENIAEITRWINRQEGKVIAIDVPTGVSADNGEVDDAVVKADYTYALHGYKPSTFLYPSSHFFGQTKVIDIGLPQSGKWKIWTEEDVRHTLENNTGNTHKGSFGTGLLIAGSDEMPGSAALQQLERFGLALESLSVAATKHASTLIGRFVP